MNFPCKHNCSYKVFLVFALTFFLSACGSDSDAARVDLTPSQPSEPREPIDTDDPNEPNEPNEPNDSEEEEEETDQIEISACRAAIYPSSQWTKCELQNYRKATEATFKQLLDLKFQTRLIAQGAIDSLVFVERTLTDPFWNSLLNLCGSIIPHCAGDPFRHPGSDEWYETIGTFYPVNFYDNEGARISGRVWAPKEPEPGKKYPAIIIVNGSVQAPETLYWWASQLLVENDYIVMTFDPRGQGYSDLTAPGGKLGSNANPVVFRRNLIDAIDFFYSTPDNVYPHNLPGAPGPRSDLNLAKTTEYNPIHELLDPERLGIAGHSMGATAVSVVQGESDWQGKMHESNPVKVAVAWDNLMLGNSLDNVDVIPRVPTMGQSGDYFLVPVPHSEPPAENKNAGVDLWRDSGVDTYQVNIRGATHYEWSLIHPFPSSYWEGGKIIAPDGSDIGKGWANPVAQYYTLAWFDRYLKLPGEKGYADSDDRLLNDSLFRDRMSWYYPSKRAYRGRDGRFHSCEYIATGC
ncbi:hypothetical protein F1529_04645 [Alcanivorax sp. VBW004]|uniref:hypothetical protein n=1 Tax=Alcanivorax sp. VBW004 TaxID=1287708 RepID=UPI0012BCF774|nr:hypothetical protein [Alcanivorax sp. VBW004]MTT51771.1 hypothetical protein [Alcanivorax sp. VBW004]